MAQHNIQDTPAARMIAHFRRSGYYSLTTFETTHNPEAREIRLYTNGSITVLLHIHQDWECDVYLPAKGTTMPLTECPECHGPTPLLCNNPECPQDKTGLALQRVRACENAWMERNNP